MKRAAAIVGAAAAIAALAWLVALHIAPYEVVSYEAARAGWRSSDAWLLDRSGEPLSRVRVDQSRRRGDWVELAQVSPALIDAVLAAEDRRFRSHGGVDWLGLAGAFRETSAGGRRGGSTITMQLAAWLHPELERSGRRDALQKWRQIRQAIALERRWAKDELLEAWLNLTAFRGELEGIDAAARALFAKRPAGLDRPESALLAALVRSPNAAAPRVAQRACVLLQKEEAACAAVQSLAAGGLVPRGRASALEGDAPHLARKLLAAPGERVRSTLDARIQRFAAATLEQHLRELEARNVEDGAVVVLDNASGEVLAWVGSAGSSGAAEVDGVTARRQPGSALKPFLYALAIEQRLLTAASILDDSSLAVTTAAGLYVPQNYDHSFRGKVSLRTALGASLNVPAVRTLALVGYEPFYEKLRALGFDSLTRGADHYGYSLALGGAEVTLLALANAYRALANDGRFSQVALKQEKNGVRPYFSAIDPRAAYVIGDILADAAARAATFGLASPLATRYVASVKTGTSTEMRDNWAVGYSARYTVGVWIGNFSGEPMHDVSGVSGAAPVWREIMDFLHEAEAPQRRGAPAGLVRQGIEYANGIEPPRDEWFLAGTESARIISVDRAPGRPRIVSPANGALLAVDPDIPPARQRVLVRVSGARAGARLLIGLAAHPAEEPLLWEPTPGRHTLRLVDEKGTEVDRVHVTVRGVSLQRTADAGSASRPAAQ